MTEYIEREAALSFLKNSLRFCENELGVGDYRKGCIAAIKDDIGNIKHIPAADVVEVVRCINCKHSDFINCERWCTFHDVRMDDNDFCSYGEAKMDGDKNERK